MAAIEREKQEKKAARKAAKVSNPTFQGRRRTFWTVVFRVAPRFVFLHPSPADRVPNSLATRQEAKKEERLAREEFALTGGNKKLTKKERKRLEQGEYE